jgi:hypothetical protein
LRRELRALLGLALLGTVCCAHASGARTDEGPSTRLGAPGQWLLDGSVGGSYELRNMRQHGGQHPVVHDVEHVSVWLAPAALHFVAPSFALGASLLMAMDRQSRDDGLKLDELGYGANVLLAYHVPLTARVFLLPRLALGASYVTKDMSMPATSPFGFGNVDRFGYIPNRTYYAALAGDLSVAHATLSIPVSVSVAEGVFLGIGPYVTGRYALEGVLRVGAPDWSLAFGIESVIGTWL